MKSAILGLSAMGVILAGVTAAYGAEDPRELPHDIPTQIEQDAQYEWTPLHWAVRRAQVDRITELATNATLEARDAQGRTPLHIAVLSGHAEIVELLIEQGADVNARDLWGNTPLRRLALVTEQRGWDRSEIAQLLRDAGGESDQDL